jgi:hypothetical protein
MATGFEQLMSELQALRTEVATLKTAKPASTRRSGAGRRRIVGEYFADPRGIMAFQNQLLDWNHEGFTTDDGSTVHLNDKHLCMVLDAEYANRDCWAISTGLLKTIRRLHNEGKHGKDDVAPTTPIPEYTE